VGACRERRRPSAFIATKLSLTRSPIRRRQDPANATVNWVEVTHPSGSEVAGAGCQSDLAGPEPILVGPIGLEMTRTSKRQYQVTARRLDNGHVVAVDSIDLGKASQRRRLIQQIREKVALPEPDAAGLDETLDQRLLQLSAEHPANPALPGLAGGAGG
jgi:hypothetical protein